MTDHPKDLDTPEKIREALIHVMHVEPLDRFLWKLGGMGGIISRIRVTPASDELEALRRAHEDAQRRVGALEQELAQRPARDSRSANEAGLREAVEAFVLDLSRPDLIDDDGDFRVGMRAAFGQVEAHLRRALAAHPALTDEGDTPAPSDEAPDSMRCLNCGNTGQGFEECPTGGGDVAVACSSCGSENVEDAEAPAAPPDSLWRPIEDAPKDGTPGIVSPAMERVSWRSLTFPDMDALSPTAATVQEGWFTRDNRPVFSPTHWMPLPEPPEED